LLYQRTVRSKANGPSLPASFNSVNAFTNASFKSRFHFIRGGNDVASFAEEEPAVVEDGAAVVEDESDEELEEPEVDPRK
jgi:hypothetical protein